MLWKKAKEKNRDDDEREGRADERLATVTHEDDDTETASAEAAVSAREFALSPHIQALWDTIFPLVGVMHSKPGESAGLFKVGPGDREGEATIYIDVPSEPYREGHPPRMERIVTLTVKMEHDYRLLGSDYYCVDCDVPTSETRH